MSDSVDITDLVEKTRATFVEWAVGYVYGLELGIPDMQWISLPVIKDVDQEIIRLVVDALSKSFVMQAFFLNTAIRKATQADDFVQAVETLDRLASQGVDDEVYNAAERAKMAAFANFVSVAA